MRRLLVLTGAVVFLDTLFFSAIAPLLPRYADEFDLSKAAAGVLAGAYPAGTLVAAVPAVLVAMRIGVRGALLRGLGFLAISSVAFGLGESAVVLDVSRFVQGAAGALCWGGSLAWLIGAAPVDRRGALIGTSLGMAVGGSLLGPALGTAAVQFGDVLVFCAVAAAALALAAWAATMPGPSGAAETASPRALLTGLRDRSVQAAGWLTTLYGLGFGAIGAVVVALLPVPDAAWIVAVLAVLSGPAVGALLAPAGAMLSDAASTLGIGQVVAVALSNVAWSTGEMLGAAGAGGPP